MSALHVILCSHEAYESQKKKIQNLLWGLSQLLPRDNMSLSERIAYRTKPRAECSLSPPMTLEITKDTFSYG